MIKKGTAIYKKLQKAYGASCPVCNKSVYAYDADKLEYVRTKAKSDIFIHTNCITKGGSQ